MVWLFIVFFGIGFGLINMSPFVACLVAFGLIAAINMAEIYRGGLIAIHFGQLEAAKALNLGRWHTFRDVVAPQMCRVALPSLATYAIGLFKDSAIASTIGVQELTYQANYLAQLKFHGLEVFGIVGTHLHPRQSAGRLDFEGRRQSPAGKGRAMTALMMGATWSDIVSWLPDLWAGFLISLRVTFLSLLFGIPAGLCLALGIESRLKPLRYGCLVVVEVGRGAPALILLQFIYFGLPSTGLSITSFASAVLGLAWCTGAYTSEILRAGLNSVPQGQREATNALGMSRADALRFVIIPQGVRVAIPALLGFSILVFQGTSLCFTIALQEIISRAYDIGNTTFLYFPALAVAGLFYAAVCIPASLLVSSIEHRAGHYSKR